MAFFFSEKRNSDPSDPVLIFLYERWDENNYNHDGRAGEHTRTRTVMTSKVGEDDWIIIIIMMAGEHTRTRTVMTSKVGGG